VTCERCWSGRHLRCEDKEGCGCDVCGERRRKIRAKTRVKLERPKRSRPATTPSKPSRPRKSSGVGRAPALTPQQMAEVRAFVEAGNSISETSRKFGVARKTIHKVIRGEYTNTRIAA
jgi:DNA invertase Pin-like site-specific DNA recombinase